MSSTAYDTCDDLIRALTEHHLLAAGGLDKAREFQQTSPDGGPEDLADYLVEEAVLTRFQANAALQGQAAQLALSFFTLVDVIGSGSMGTVYRARSTKDDGWFAIKIVPRRNVVNLGSIVEKVEALKQVRHPRVSAMVHVGAQGERVYMAWPLLEGGEKLDTMVQRLGKLMPRQAAQIAQQIASGLQAYHDFELFHGLLKPSDILIGIDRRVRILDFGVGFLLTCERGKSLLDTTTNGKALARGLDCASPESIADPLNRTVAGDQYSLGCILYYCLAGRFPFPDNNPVVKMMGHQFEEPTPIDELVEDVPPRLAAVVHRLLGKEPAERFASIAEAAQELGAITSGSRSPSSPANGARAVRPSTQGAVRTPSAPAAAKSPPQAAKPAAAVRPSARLKESMPEAPPARLALWLTLTGVGAAAAGGLLTWLLSR